MLLNGFEIDDNSGVPVWMQVRKRLVYLITSGWYKAGDCLPTVRELAAEIGINYNTVSKAYQDLARDGYVINNRGRSVTVADIGKSEILPADAEVVMLVDMLIEKAKESGMCTSEIVELLRKRDVDR